VRIRIKMRMPSAVSVAIASSLCSHRNSVRRAFRGGRCSSRRSRRVEPPTSPCADSSSRLGADRGRSQPARSSTCRLAEARAHDLRRVTEFLVVVVDLRHRGDAGSSSCGMSSTPRARPTSRYGRRTARSA
jgi:hypothetical protein